MHSHSELIEQLRNSIGSEVEYCGMRCTVVELLEQPLCLVLQALGARIAIQENQYGLPYRRVTPVFTIPCLTSDGEGCINPELLTLGLCFE